MPTKEELKNTAYFTLKQEAKKMGLETKGTKEEIIARLLGEDKSTPEEPIQLSIHDVKASEGADELVKKAEEYEAESKKLGLGELGIIDIPQQGQYTGSVDPSVLNFGYRGTPKEADFFAPYINQDRLEKLARKFDMLAMHSPYRTAVKWQYVLDADNQEFYVSFKGGAAQASDTTLVDTDDVVLNVARHHFNDKLLVGKNALINTI